MPSSEPRKVEETPAVMTAPSGRSERSEESESTSRPARETAALPEAEVTPTELGKRLRAAEEAEARGEVVGELWTLGSPEAVEILRQQFFAERETDVKVDIVAGLVEHPMPNTREVRFGILVAAMGATQPVDVRTTAIAIGTDFDDIRAVALLQNLLQDPIEEIREAAMEALEARRENDAK